MDELGLSDEIFDDGNSNNCIASKKTATRHFEGCNGDINGLKSQLYVPKQCTENWFSGISVTEDSSIEDSILVKNEADLLYYRKHFQKAADRYNELIKCREFTQSKPVLRELHESVCRCALKLGNVVEAEKHVLPMLELHANGNDASVHLLAYDTYIAQGNYRRALDHIVKAVNTNTLYPKFWLNLFTVLEELKLRGEVCVTMDECKCVITDSLLRAVLLQGHFFLGECVRGQTDERVLHFNSIKNVLESKMESLAKIESLKMNDPTLENGMQNELNLSLLVDDSEGDTQDSSRASFFSRWLSVNVKSLS